MFQSLVSRRLPPSAALPARPSHIASWTNLFPRNNNQNQARRTPHCLFSSTSSSQWSHVASLKAAGPSGYDDSLPYYSPHQPKRQWPPDISKLSSKHQFRLERKYRRRAALKWERPRWKKWTKIMQYGLYAYILIYAVFYIDWGDDHPVSTLRDYMLSSLKSIFSPPPSPESMRKPDDKAAE